MASPARRLPLLAALLATTLLAGSAAAQATTPLQDNVDHLLFVIVLFAIGVAVVVYGAIAYALVRYRERPGPPPLRRPRTHNARLEIAWTLAASVVIVAIGLISVPAMLVLDAPPEGADYAIDVYAQQFLWSFRYPDGFEATTDLYLQEGLTFVLNVRSRDVIHSFFVPDLGARIDAVPGRVTQTWIEARVPGVYPLVCAEYCGVGHSEMVGRIVVFEAGTQPLPFGPPAELRLPPGTVRLVLRDDAIEPPTIDLALGDPAILLLVNEGTTPADFVLGPPYNLTVTAVPPGGSAWLNFTADQEGDVTFYVEDRRVAGAEGTLRVLASDVVVDVEMKEFGGSGERPWSIEPSVIRVEPGDRVTLRIWSNSSYPDGTNGVPHNFTLGAPLFLDAGQAWLNGERNPVVLTFAVPDEAVAVDYLCAVPGHADLGMVGVLLVGDPQEQQALTFPAYITLVVVTAAVALVLLARVLAKRPRTP